MLSLEARSSNISISDINNTVTRASQTAQMQLQSRAGTLSVTVDCMVADRVTNKLPALTFKRSAFDLPHNIQLADSQFHVSSDINVYWAQNYFGKFFVLARLRFRQGIQLQKTRLGWILAGRLANYQLLRG